MIPLVGVLMLVCAACTLGPLRAGARCTPATHKARQALGAVCALLVVVGVARFIYFIGIRGHALWQTSVAMGVLVDVVFAIQAVLLWRSKFPPRPVSIVLAVTCALIAARAFFEVLR